METSVVITSARGKEVIPVEAVLEQRRNVFICGEINDDMAVAFTQHLMHLNCVDPILPIRVFINSAGGEINAGMVMYDVIRHSRAPIQLCCIGKAYSMAAVLLACGGKGSRFLLPHSKVMIHEPLISNGIGGKSSSIQTISDSLMKTKREMEEILAEHTGKTPEEIAENTRTDHFFNAEEAVAFGLVDEIKTFDAMLSEEGEK